MSTKPWEQEWTDDGVGRIKASDAITLEVKVAFWMVPGGDAEAARQADEVRKVAKAAPDMARALMRHLDGCANTGSRTRGCDEIEAKHLCRACEAKSALRKAGVL